MSNTNFCGIDFGTSNSTIGYFKEPNGVQLATLEGGKMDMPSTIFFDNEDRRTYFGREAIDRYMDGDEGRFFRALKSILGTNLAGTSLSGRHLEFEHLISLYLNELKTRAETHSNCELSQLVLGRPVHFVDGDEERDKTAQETLENAARQCGFTDIEFQFEPIAAALAYESTITDEKLALIIDLGAGTADFTTIRLHPGASTADRKNDILSTKGVHIGGVDLDKRLSLKKVMPLFGYETMDIHNPDLELPAEHFNNLATWPRINELYQRKSINEVRRMLGNSKEKPLVERLLRVIESRRGHQVALEVETAKILLSQASNATLDFDFVESNLETSITRLEHDQAISNECHGMKKCMESCVSAAGLKADQIGTVFITGGTSSVVQAKEMLLSPFTNADIIEGDKFGSVGTGLALHAARIYG